MLERIKNLVVGRPNGLRRRILTKLFSEGEDTSPNANFSSPIGYAEDEESSIYTPSKKEPPKGSTLREKYVEAQLRMCPGSLSKVSVQSQPALKVLSEEQ